MPHAQIFTQQSGMPCLGGPQSAWQVVRSCPVAACDHLQLLSPCWRRICTYCNALYLLVVLTEPESGSQCCPDIVGAELLQTLCLIPVRYQWAVPAEAAATAVGHAAAFCVAMFSDWHLERV